MSRDQSNDDVISTHVILCIKLHVVNICQVATRSDMQFRFKFVYIVSQEKCIIRDKNATLLFLIKKGALSNFRPNRTKVSAFFLQLCVINNAQQPQEGVMLGALCQVHYCHLNLGADVTGKAMSQARCHYICTKNPIIVSPV